MLFTSSLLLLSCLAGTEAHSWVEQMLVIKNGKYTGLAGYMRGYAPRGAGFNDDLNVNLLPPLSSGRIRIDNTDAMCKSTQNSGNQTAGFPKLNAAPGDYVALRYLENGHVTLPQNQLGKPGSGGTVMIYATTQPQDDEKLTNVLKWNTDGTGGDKRGKLLTVQNFDDGRCYQINSSPISTQRQQQFPNKAANAPDGPSEEMWCETNVKLPSDVQAGGDLTLYWAWQWNTLPNVDPGIPKGKDEWYTSCMDVNVLAEGQISKTAATPPTKLLVQDPQKEANPKFELRAANTTLPDGGPEGGDGNNGNAAPDSGSSSSGASPTTPASPASTAPAASASTPASNSPMFPGLTSLAPIPFPTDGIPHPTGGAAGMIGGAHTLTLTQVITLTFNGKRSVEVRTMAVPDVAAVKRRALLV